jgi:hypothetical protein
MAEGWAAEFGVKLEPTGHTELKFMGPNGCTVPPHFRPNCTLHECSINSLGFKPRKSNWTKEYFKLRDKIMEVEYENEERESRLGAVKPRAGRKNADE